MSHLELAIVHVHQPITHWRLKNNVGPCSGDTSPVRKWKALISERAEGSDAALWVEASGGQGSSFSGCWWLWFGMCVPDSPVNLCVDCQ